jgi:hypothetical protein
MTVCFVSDLLRSTGLGPVASAECPHRDAVDDHGLETERRHSFIPILIDRGLDSRAGFSSTVWLREPDEGVGAD